ncbi:WD40-repeat-containing domain protein [Cercophora newfieldiana]|uniref:ASTRA-associated protein 1 n=1 Tax=Cercophora newfieldiana TaxID=92897 RepID=A0AA39XWD2_9PEZI|nr:WD40-repeat-containing domain protein [Cercophora newfieldiana]
MSVEERPPQPKSILRGHKASVHAAAFVRGNERLLTGDADGFVIAWDLTIMRPRAVWQAHTNAILGLSGWGHERVVTHGRDNKLIVWKLTVQDEDILSTTLPLDPTLETRPQPWILNLLEINTMNFCSFSSCPVSSSLSLGASAEMLVAVPNTLASEAIDIFHIPSQERRHTVKLGGKNGMVMALSLFHLDRSLTLIAGYENGLAIVVQLNAQRGWEVKYQATCHSQPVLSLDVSPSREFFLTSSADAIVAKHPLPLSRSQTGTELATRSEQKAAIAGGQEATGGKTAGKSLLSAVLAAEDPAVPTSTTPQTTNVRAEGAHVATSTEPLKVMNTKHAGQQSLHVRSDGRVFVTAGWDSKVRVYSAKTMKEVAVLKWHQVGCYAAALAEVGPAGDGEDAGRAAAKHDRAAPDLDNDQNDLKQQEDKTSTVVPKLVEISVRDKRIRQAKSAHWLAAGSKDGKVSLWDIF